jgi:hypothetical protein
MTQPATLQGDAALTRFLALDAFLVEHQHLWRPRPFVQSALPWETAHSELATWLRRRSLADAERAHLDPGLLNAPAPYPALAHQAQRLAALGPLSTTPLHTPSPRLNVDVPGRKWQQIDAFGNALAFARPPTHWLDWCAGKGHLGRRLLGQGQRLTCLEFDPALIQAGHALSQRHRLDAAHRQQDVLDPSAQHCLQAHHTPVALHACGDLHVRLLHLASQAGCQQLAIAPCCYNRIAGDCYHPLSQPAQASRLRLDSHDLSLPASETVTAGTRVRRQRDQSMAWRLGFDLLQRRLRGCDSYLPTPSLPTAWLGKSFAEYCQDLAALKGLPVPGEQDWSALESAGQARLAEVRNLELVRGLFRRPLELWLALDRVLLLRENGYEAELGTFCEAGLTPRNLMIRAQRGVVDKSVGNELA